MLSLKINIAFVCNHFQVIFPSEMSKLLNNFIISRSNYHVTGMLWNWSTVWPWPHLSPRHIKSLQILCPRGGHFPNIWDSSIVIIIVWRVVIIYLWFFIFRLHRNITQTGFTIAVTDIIIIFIICHLMCKRMMGKCTLVNVIFTWNSIIMIKGCLNTTENIPKTIQFAYLH